MPDELELAFNPFTKTMDLVAGPIELADIATIQGMLDSTYNEVQGIL